MKVYDISQEVFSCEVYNLTAFSMCAHNGTHIDAPMAVHLTLLGSDVVLLEGIRLPEVSEGVYFLNAAPLNLSGADGSPCRAVLIDIDER